jgi:hypothetical protein
MLEGLKNVGLSFPECPRRSWERNYEEHTTYVDDIVVISTIRKNHVADIPETFANLRMANSSLNPEKFVFRVHKRKVLGCLISTKGIKANPDKIKSLDNMEEPQTVKDVQKLIGRNTTLNRFIP